MSPTSYPSVAGKKTPRSLSKATAQPGPTALSLAGTKRRVFDALVAPVTDNRGEAWQKWIDFCDEVGVNPLLEAFADKVPLLQVFIHRVRIGTLAAQGDQIKSRLVEYYLQSVAQKFLAVGSDDPRLNTSHRTDVRIRKMLAA